MTIKCPLRSCISMNDVKDLKNIWSYESSCCRTLVYCKLFLLRLSLPRGQIVTTVGGNYKLKVKSKQNMGWHFLMSFFLVSEKQPKKLYEIIIWSESAFDGQDHWPKVSHKKLLRTKVKIWKTKMVIFWPKVSAFCPKMTLFSESDTIVKKIDKILPNLILLDQK